VVGQDAVVRTLRNAVQRGRVHHAYLFVGSRGTGKTSMAKILAACLNCEYAAGQGSGEREVGQAGAERGAGGLTAEPCGECESCRAIAQARSLDVIEMDAASNNSVDDVRELRESVAFAPVSGRHKVYILDEAHMLSTAAWNAFLKTLEEPPPNTVFVLATTEAQKVPATVVDRCHRFDFQRPTVEQIADVLRRAAAAESIAIPPAALAAVARAATGSFRDALGTLEQLVTYSSPSGSPQAGSSREIALEDVLAVLGATDARLLEETLDAVQAGDARGALLAVAQCAAGGRDAGAFAADLEVRARELLLVATLGEVPAELALTPEADARLAEQARRVDAGTAVRLLEQLGAALEAVKAGADPRTQLELALVKAARPEVDVSLRALLDRIERLERGVGAPTAPTPAAASIPAAPIEPVATTSPPVAEASGAVPAQAPADLETLGALWPAVVELVGTENKMLSAVLREARPVALGDGELLVAFAATASFLKKKAEGHEHRATVTEALRELTGDRRLRVEYELREELPPPPVGAADLVGGPLRTEEEWVARFVDELDAEELPAEWAPPAAAPQAN
jgi:DNA polymerase-3 subunit gamma/tau